MHPRSRSSSSRAGPGIRNDRATRAGLQPVTRAQQTESRDLRATRAAGPGLAYAIECRAEDHARVVAGGVRPWIDPLRAGWYPDRLLDLSGGGAYVRSARCSVDRLRPPPTPTRAANASARRLGSSPAPVPGNAPWPTRGFVKPWPREATKAWTATAPRMSANVPATPRQLGHLSAVLTTVADSGNGPRSDAEGSLPQPGSTDPAFRPTHRVRAQFGRVGPPMPRPRNYPAVAEHLENAREDVLRLRSPSQSGGRSGPTSPQERLNREIRRQTDIVGIFPGPGLPTWCALLCMVGPAWARSSTA